MGRRARQTRLCANETHELKSECGGARLSATSCWPGWAGALHRHSRATKASPENQNRNGAHSDTAADLDPGLRCAAPG
jgi:hypothetical protein